jgi:hypothetical protein
MLEFKHKVGLIMIEGFTRGKGLSRVTAYAGFLRELGIKHSFMFVHVTVLTVTLLLAGEDKLLPVFRRLGREHDLFGRLVTFHTFLSKFLVSTRQLKVSLGVIEVIDLVEAVWSVTARAGAFHIFLFKLLLMNRRMAVGTEVRIRSSAELEEVSWLRNFETWNILFRRHVTGPAVLNALVFADQFETSRIVIER